MSPRLAIGDPDSVCTKREASHAPSSNKRKTAACTKSQAVLTALPNIENAMQRSISQETNRNGTPNTGKNPATTSMTAASVLVDASSARVRTWPQRP